MVPMPTSPQAEELLLECRVTVLPTEMTEYWLVQGKNTSRLQLVSVGSASSSVDTAGGSGKGSPDTWMVVVVVVVCGARSVGNVCCLCTLYKWAQAKPARENPPPWLAAADCALMQGAPQLCFPAALLYSPAPTPRSRQPTPNTPSRPAPPHRVQPARHAGAGGEVGKGDQHHISVDVLDGDAAVSVELGGGVVPWGGWGGEGDRCVGGSASSAGSAGRLFGHSCVRECSCSLPVCFRAAASGRSYTPTLQVHCPRQPTPTHPACG